jgi:hypothetical protein
LGQAGFVSLSKDIKPYPKWEQTVLLLKGPEGKSTLYICLSRELPACQRGADFAEAETMILCKAE